MGDEYEGKLRRRDDGELRERLIRIETILENIHIVVDSRFETVMKWQVARESHCDTILDKVNKLELCLTEMKVKIGLIAVCASGGVAWLVSYLSK